MSGTIRETTAADKSSNLVRNRLRLKVEEFARRWRGPGDIGDISSVTTGAGHVGVCDNPNNEDVHFLTAAKVVGEFSMILWYYQSK